MSKKDAGAVSYRDDLKLAPLALQLGWSAIYAAVDHKLERKTPRVWQEGDPAPCMPLTFLKGDKWVWRCRDGWRSADLSSANRYTNHKWEENLESALKKY